MAVGKQGRVEPYEAGLARGRPQSIKTPLSGRVVVVLDTRRDQRGLALIHPQTRCIRAADVHEIIVTDEQSRGPGDQVEHVAGVGFFAFDESGVIMVGDEIRTDRTGLIGAVVGFDESHAPNHFNIVVQAARSQTGRELGLRLGDRFVVVGREAWPS